MVLGCAGAEVPQAGLRTETAAANQLDATEQAMLEFHNRLRADVGVPPLEWSDALAARAQAWADHLASAEKGLAHSGNIGSGMGENLAMWTAGKKSPVELISLWSDEKAVFDPGTFPNVSRDGNWRTVAHYTQMIWHSTRDVGCALATGGGNDYLVCEYSPQGNVMTEAVY